MIEFRVVSLSCSSPHTGDPMEPDLHHGHGVVVEHGGDIFGGELVGCVGNEQAGLSNGAVTDHDTPEEKIGG